MDPCNDPGLKSFVAIAADHPFPIQNLPYGVIRSQAKGIPHPAVRIGDLVLDLQTVEAAGLLRGAAPSGVELFQADVLNPFLQQPRSVWRRVRARISELLRHDQALLRDDAALRAAALLPAGDVQMCMPVSIGDYTDFYSSRHHAFNVGTMFRGPENALMPNYLWVPVGYHGRASSIVVSGTPVRRPSGQTKSDTDTAPRFGPTQRLDFELEAGFFFGGPANALGTPIPIERAEEHIFGLVLVNDWSARDIQAWEYQPLGPFLSKNFATSISPWIVSLDALEPFRRRPSPQEPAPLAYLRSKPSEEGSSAESAPEAGWTFDIALEVALATAAHPEPHTICRSNFRHLYWTMAQQLAHHTITGCSLRPGDLLASGTISGPTEASYGSMLELAWRGTRPIQLPGGEERRFLQDGDSVILHATCKSEGRTIGFGECAGRILPALRP